MTRAPTLLSLAAAAGLAACGGPEEGALPPFGTTANTFGPEAAAYTAAAAAAGLLAPTPPAELPPGAATLTFTGKVALWNELGGDIGVPAAAEYIGDATLVARLGDGEVDMTLDGFLAPDDTAPGGSVTSTAAIGVGSSSFSGAATGAIGAATVSGTTSGGFLGATFPAGASAVLDLTMSQGMLLIPYTGLVFTEQELTAGID